MDRKANWVSGSIILLFGTDRKREERGGGGDRDNSHQGEQVWRWRVLIQRAGVAERYRELEWLD